MAALVANPELNAAAAGAGAAYTTVMAMMTTIETAVGGTIMAEGDK